MRRVDGMKTLFQVLVIAIAFVGTAPSCADMADALDLFRRPTPNAADYCPNAGDQIDLVAGVALRAARADGTPYPPPVWYDACGTHDRATGWACYVCWDNVRSARVLVGGQRCSQDTGRRDPTAPAAAPDSPVDQGAFVVCTVNCEGCQ